MRIRKHHHPVPSLPSARAARAALLLALLAASPAALSQTPSSLFIREYRVQGSTKLTPLEIEQAIYPFLGPGRTVEDVEQARGVLENTFRQKGFQTVSVLIPNQDPRSGVIILEVVEGTVGRLRVSGATWFLPSRIKTELPSLAEGSVPDFEKVKQEILAVNRLPDRRVTPSLVPGSEPGTFDINLEVEDKFPLHGSIELNNRYNADTTPLRLNASLSYGNLFQLGHTIGGNFQIAPERINDAFVYSAYYLARVSAGVTLMIQGTKQDSDISTLGGAAVAGRGEIAGIRTLFDLPSSTGFHQTFSLGVDYKSFDEDLTIAGETVNTPIEYYPVSANYSASWIRENSFTEAGASLNFHIRGLGSGARTFDEKRIGADGSYIFLRGDVSHTRDLKNESQLFAKIQGQASSQPLVNSEQFSGGGLGTARGYLEATALGDNGIFATVEYRTPSFIGSKGENGKRANEWRVHAFVDGGVLSILDPLPAQTSRHKFLSVGAGSRLRLREHYNASLDFGIPLVDQTNAGSGDIRVTFRGWAEF